MEYKKDRFDPLGAWITVMLVNALGAILFSGCSGGRIETRKYPDTPAMKGFVVYITSPHRTEEECKNKNGMTIEDDGTATGNGKLVTDPNSVISKYYPTTRRGCWYKDSRIMWLSWEATAKTVLHEFCHVYGLPENICGKEYPGR